MNEKLNFLRNKKAVAVLLLIVFVIIVAILNQRKIYDHDELDYGITFSKKQAEDLGLDWRKLFEEMLSDLKIKNLRISAYWNEVEVTKDQYDWQTLDWQIDTASAQDANIILAVGGRLPRWPECHFPSWLNQTDSSEKEKKMLSYIEATIRRYKDNQNIIAWQVENEPFLPHFGECPDLDVKILDKEIALVRSLDARPVVVTDSGELSIWVRAASRADIFGTTMYRDTYSKELGRYIHYPIGPWFFKIKTNLAKLFAKPAKWIVIELQGEPWGKIAFQNLPKEERDLTMNEKKFTEIIEFARQTGFQEFYLWGVEWWYWEKEKQNNPYYWEEAKKLFNNKEMLN